MLLRFQKMVTDFVDPLQFAYREGRGVDDAILYVLDHVYSHLDKPATSIRLMFYDFSSAFNTIQPHLLAEKLLTMNVQPTLILWVFDYLTNRPQFVRLRSDTKCNAKSLFSDVYLLPTHERPRVQCSPRSCFLCTLYYR